MSILVVGAGAAGGYLGAQLIAAGRDVTFLVHAHTQARLRAQGLRIRRGAQTATTAVKAVTVSELGDTYDIVIVAVRTNAVESAIRDARATVTADTRVVPVMNGIHHLSLLTAAFGTQVVLGAAVRLGTSALVDGTIDEAVPGIGIELGQLDGGRGRPLSDTAAQLDVNGVAVTIRDDVVAAMWEKFAFIACTAALTCLVGAPIGVIAATAGGGEVARAVLAEFAAVATAHAHPLSDTALSHLETVLTDPSSTFGPSMFRDLNAGRPVEASVLDEVVDGAREQQIGTPLIHAALPVLHVHNSRVG